MTQEALKLALDALENHTAIKHPQQIHYRDKAIAAVKEALAQPEQEPVAWMHVQGNYKEPSFRELADDEVERGWEQYPLYNTPPQRTWVGLTKKEVHDLYDADYVVFHQRIEAKLKEKNT